MNEKTVKLNRIAGVCLAVFGLSVIAAVFTLSSGLVEASFVSLGPGALAWYGVKAFADSRILYYLEDSGTALTKVFQDGRHESMRWDEIEDVRYRRIYDQLILIGPDGTKKFVIDCQLTDFGELFGKVKEVFPDLPYRFRG